MSNITKENDDYDRVFEGLLTVCKGVAIVLTATAAVVAAASSKNDD